MDITESIAKQIGGELEILILKNREFIFVYANDNINQYLWKDMRFGGYCNVFHNKKAETRREMIQILKSHLKIHPLQ